MAKCIICGWEGNAWKSYNGRAAKCGKCGSTERQRALFSTLTSVKLFPPPHHPWVTLSVSSDACLRTLFYREYFHQTVDVSPGGIVKKATFLALPHKTGSLDMLIHLHVMEHIRDAEKALSEAFRVLKPDGVMVSSVPLNNGAKVEEYDKPTRSHGHWRQYSESGYLAALTKAGFLQTLAFKLTDDPALNLGPDPVFISRKSEGGS